MIHAFRQGQKAYHSDREFERAQACFMEASSYASDLKLRAWTCASELYVSRTCVLLGQFEEAASRLNRLFYVARRNGLPVYIPIIWMEEGILKILQGESEEGEFQLRKAYNLASRHQWREIQAIILFRQGQVYHHELKFYGLAMEYFRQVLRWAERTPLWPALIKQVREEVQHCKQAIDELDIARILGPVPLQRLRQDYLSGLLHHFVGIPGIENQEQLGERIGLTRQAIYRNVKRY